MENVTDQVEDLERGLYSQKGLRERLQVEELVLEVTCQVRALLGAVSAFRGDIQVDRDQPLMHHVVQGVAEPAQ